MSNVINPSCGAWTDAIVVTMKNIMCAAIAAAFLTGCGMANALRNEAKLYPDGNSFVFSAYFHSWDFAPEDPKAEQTRLEYLKWHLDTNSMCPAGFEITSRRVMIEQKDLNERGHVIYRGACKS